MQNAWHFCVIMVYQRPKQMRRRLSEPYVRLQVDRMNVSFSGVKSVLKIL